MLNGSGVRRRSDCGRGSDAFHDLSNGDLSCEVDRFFQDTDIMGVKIKSLNFFEKS